jgi:7-cyano-7-deazaguanine synthase
VSGGMDSTVLTAYIKHLGIDKLHGVGFNYGQRHNKELTFAANNRFIDTWHEVNLQNLNVLLQGSSLTSADIEVPDGHYAEESMKATVVPNRNMIMLSIAIGYAVSLKADAGVWFGVHAGDHFIYPDCRPEFVDAISHAAMVGTDGFSNGDMEVRAPFSNMTKAQIARMGYELDVNFAKTWSCYKGGEVHCGRCGTCVERKEAFRVAQVIDPTAYLDPDFEVQAYYA